MFYQKDLLWYLSLYLDPVSILYFRICNKTLQCVYSPEYWKYRAKTLHTQTIFNHANYIDVYFLSHIAFKQMYTMYIRYARLYDLVPGSEYYYPLTECLSKAIERNDHPLIRYFLKICDHTAYGIIGKTANLSFIKELHLNDNERQYLYFGLLERKLSLNTPNHDLNNLIDTIKYDDIFMTIDDSFPLLSQIFADSYVNLSTNLIRYTSEDTFRKMAANIAVEDRARLIKELAIYGKWNLVDISYELFGRLVPVLHEKMIYYHPDSDRELDERLKTSKIGCEAHLFVLILGLRSHLIQEDEIIMLRVLQVLDKHSISIPNELIKSIIMGDNVSLMRYIIDRFGIEYYPYMKKSIFYSSYRCIDYLCFCYGVVPLIDTKCNYKFRTILQSALSDDITRYYNSK